MIDSPGLAALTRCRRRGRADPCAEIKYLRQSYRRGLLRAEGAWSTLAAALSRAGRLVGLDDRLFATATTICLV